MGTYVIKRLLLIIPTLFLITIIVFLTVRFIPGSIVDLMLQQMMGMEGGMGGAAVGVTLDRAGIEHMLGLDMPIHIQYGQWVGNVILHGDFGDSIWQPLTVVDLVVERLPVSIELGILGLIIGLIIALPIGIWSAIRQDSITDYIGRSIAIVFIAVPGFWIGTMIMVYPSIWWQWTPPMLYINFIDDPIGNLGMNIIPAVLLGMVLSGVTMRMTRTMVLEVLRQDYIRTAWSKGLRERVIIMRHVLKNALIPVVTIVGMQVPVMIGGTVIIEQIFNLPGMGRLLIKAIGSRDYPVVSGINLMIASFVLLNNIVVDIAYAYLDPRIQYK